MIHVQNHHITFFPPENAAYLMGDFTDWDERPLPLEKPLTVEFPRGAYVEYAFLDAHLQPLADEENLQRPDHPWYPYHRACVLPGNTFQVPPRVSTLRGTITEHRIASRALESPRMCIVYEPAIAPVATLLIHDGNAFYQKLALHRVAETLLEQKHIKPIRLVFIEPQDRVKDYWFNTQYEAFLLEELLPTLARDYRPTSQYGVWGASLGGMVSAWLALRNPALFSCVISFSGCFTADPQGGNYYHDQEWLTNLFTHTNPPSFRFYMETGLLEWLLAPNRRFAAMLADKKYPHQYCERPGGHNWKTWEQGIVPALSYLFGREE